MAFDNDGNLLVTVASAVRGISSVSSGAVSSGNADHPLVSRGLYRCDGVSCTQIFVSPPPTRGSTTVKVDPTHAGIIYVNTFGGGFAGPNGSGGIYRSVDNGATWTQIFAPTDNTLNTFNAALEIDEFDVTTLPSGATRMYVGAGSGGAAFSRLHPRRRSGGATTRIPRRPSRSSAEIRSSTTARGSAGTTTTSTHRLAHRTSSTSAVRTPMPSCTGRRTGAPGCCRRTPVRPSAI